jgi:hypothetical protein
MIFYIITNFLKIVISQCHVISLSCPETLLDYCIQPYYYLLLLTICCYFFSILSIVYLLSNWVVSSNARWRSFTFLFFFWLALFGSGIGKLATPPAFKAVDTSIQSTSLNHSAWLPSPFGNCPLCCSCVTQL